MDAALNMALDEVLLNSIARIDQPILRIYKWKEPAATFGYFQKYAEIAAWTSLRPLIRRPTGGGLVPHDADWTYSVIIPPTDPWYDLRAVESYSRMHMWVAAALKKSGIDAALASARDKQIPGQCFIGAEQHDVLFNGRKIAGAAQRRARGGLLIQGSIQPGEFMGARASWENAMLESIPYQCKRLPERMFAAALKLADSKYSLDAHNQRR